MAARIEAVFEYMAEHPAVLLIVGGMFFVLVSVFTAPVDSGTTSFLRSLSLMLIVGGVVLYILLIGMRFIVRFIRKLFHLRISFDDENGT
jgi:hypothetical protein